MFQCTLTYTFMLPLLPYPQVPTATENLPSAALLPVAPVPNVGADGGGRGSWGECGGGTWGWRESMTTVGGSSITTVIMYMGVVKGVWESRTRVRGRGDGGGKWGNGGSEVSLPDLSSLVVWNA